MRHLFIQIFIILVTVSIRSIKRCYLSILELDKCYLSIMELEAVENKIALKLVSKTHLFFFYGIFDNLVKIE